MRSLLDVTGNPVIASSHGSVEQLNQAADAYYRARADAASLVRAVVDRDPACAMAHCFDGYLAMLASRREGAARARQSVTAGVEALARTSWRNWGQSREVMHLAALDAWSAGRLTEAATRWDHLLAEYPRDLTALKMSQFVLSYLGESQRMLQTVEGVAAAWGEGQPQYGFFLGCHAYALEETGDYERARAVGIRAVELNRSDIWAAHAVAHVAEMQGALAEGIAWIGSLRDEWAGCSNFANHLRWHEALYLLELGESAAVLSLYDRVVGAPGSEEYLDIANAASLLWRLEQADVDVGERWRDLAERAARNVGDHALVFADAHYIMAMAASGSASQVEHFMASSEGFASEDQGTESKVMCDVGLALMRAIVAHRRHDYDVVVDELLPVRERIRQIGGSHAQRDVFTQMLIDAAWRGGRLAIARELLEERTAARPGNLWGWRHKAMVLDAINATGSSAWREHERLHRRQSSRG